jgi:hypothetical protein
MMAKKPDERFQSAGEVSANLKEWLADRGRTIGGGHIEEREHESGVGSGIFTRFAMSTPTPPPVKSPSGSSRTISVSDRDTKRLDQKDSGTGEEEEIGLAPLDDEDVLGVANRRVAAKQKEKEKEPEKKAPSKSDVVTGSDVTKTKGGSGSGRGRSLIEEELHDPEEDTIKRKVAQRAQFNPLQPPGFAPPSQGPNWGLIIGIGAAIVIVLTLLVVVLF